VRLTKFNAQGFKNKDGVMEYEYTRIGEVKG